MRKTNLDRLLALRPDGIFVAPFEQGEIGPDLFRKACEFGLEGLVSKRADPPYRAGRSMGEGQEPEASSDEQGDGRVLKAELAVNLSLTIHRHRFEAVWNRTAQHN
jgi:hypothetical protein